MARTTATVTVGADTKPFDRKMRTLGKGLRGTGAAIGAGAGRVARAGMSGLGAGVGLGLGFLGLKGAGGNFNEMLAASPKLAGAVNQLKVAFQQALIPAAIKLADFLLANMPAITQGLEMFGNALADAIQFWTEDAFNPDVWRDIGVAIADSVRDAMKLAVEDGRGAAIGTARELAGGGTGGEVAAGAAAAAFDLNPLTLIMRYNEFVFSLFSSDETEGAASL